MKKQSLKYLYAVLSSIIFLTACNISGNRNSTEMNNYEKGTYGYDVAFFKNNDIGIIELKDEESSSSVLIVPAYQGRVMTSSADGNEGVSFGWINYSFIESGEENIHMSPYGGEERIWLGPEGGPFSIYFKKGEEQVYDNWKVPAEIDTEAFDIISQSPESVLFNKKFTVTNASGTELNVGIDRKVSILNRDEAAKSLDIDLGSELSLVAYETENILANTGETEWNSSTGVLSIWLLSMFNPTENAVVFIPFKQGDESESGNIVNDDYFGKVPADRLVIKDGIIFFKVDGKYRSKIGISPKRALPLCGSYDPKNKALTLLWYSPAEKPSAYVNSKWGEQDDPLSGDVVNSYNDGPLEDGSMMGPFYEIESSSPAAMLSAGEKIVHTQRIYHISGEENDLDKITEKLFGLSIPEINGAFLN